MPENIYFKVLVDIRNRYPELRSSTLFENFKSTSNDEQTYIGSVLVGPPYVFNVYQHVHNSVVVTCEGDGNEFVVAV